MDGGTGRGSDAGFSAHEEAARSRRNAAKRFAEAARLTEEAARLTAQAADAKRKADYLEHRGQSFQVGAEGEIATGRILDSLGAEGWIVLHDVRWPGRCRANIDHIAIGPGGIVVIDTKKWSGRVDVRDEALRQNGQRREREVASAADAAIAVVMLLPADLHSVVRPVICLARDEWVDVTARDVQITSTASLSAFLRGLGPVLSATGVGRASQALERALRPRASSAVAPAVASQVSTARSAARRSSPRRRAASRRSSPRRRAASHPKRQPTSRRRRPSRRNQQSIIPAVVVLAVLLFFIWVPTALPATIDWLAETVGAVVADAVIPEPSPAPSTSPAPPTP